MQWDNKNFDRSTFERVILWICSKSDASLGKVKLHKTLYFADMLHFKAYGKPMTGETYIKQQFGPTARHLSSTIESLCEEGRLRVREENYFGFSKTFFDPVGSIRSDLMKNEEIEILNEVLPFVLRNSASKISELSHTLAWQITENGEEMPYASAYLWQPVEITEDDLKWASSEILQAEASA